jgi:hypothetical protein
MMKLLMTRGAAALAVLVAVMACSGPATTPPATSPPTTVAASPTFDCSQYGQLPGSKVAPGFDPILEALFPTTIDGHGLLQAVLSGPLMASLCPSPASLQDYAQEFVDGLPAGWDAASLTSALAEYDFTGSPSVIGIRAPGHDGSELFSAVSTMPDANGLAGAPIEQVGGKQATVITGESGQQTYLYATGEVMFLVEDADQTDAAAILSALP